MEAADKGHTSVVLTLLKHNADAAIKSKVSVLLHGMARPHL